MNHLAINFQDEKEVEESAKEKTVVDDEPQKVFETSDEPSTKESTEEEVIKKKSGKTPKSLFELCLYSVPLDKWNF